ncbi:NAD(P)/FAD-dependent oxidoreductase [Candidatus Pantoea multigeneris]|uniref:FAD-binding oxidoreductase n=1 Tax=Candidatus Pantoea multigeneris TaxID=2608357 RepID=A0ABX0RDK5_9GAMM|nr:FAD-binding oxidoreductase [Pantoea multigeneris]NIF23423.1 FAD-binding oxidoreductase [Pantoea multigeneris]
MKNVVIIGGGVIGSAIFHHLSKYGNNKVTLIEKDEVGQQGATSVSGGILRCFHNSLSLTSEANYGLNFYRDIAQKENFPGNFIQTGCVYPVHTQSDFDYVKELAIKYKSIINIEIFDSDRVQELMPFINWSNYQGAVFEPDAGYLCPRAASQFFIDEGSNAENTVINKTKCLRIVRQYRNVIGVETTAGFIPADIVIVAAGAWSGRLAEDSDITLPASLRVKAIQMASVQSNVLRENVIPAFLDEVTGAYGRGAQEGGLMFGASYNMWDIDPNDFPTHDELQHEIIMKECKRLFNLPDIDSCQQIRMFDCYTDNDRPLVCSSDTRGLFWATGFSGGGFKFAPYVAERIFEIINRS